MNVTVIVQDAPIASGEEAVQVLLAANPSSKPSSTLEICSGPSVVFLSVMFRDAVDPIARSPRSSGVGDTLNGGGGTVTGITTRRLAVPACTSP